MKKTYLLNKLKTINIKILIKKTKSSLKLSREITKFITILLLRYIFRLLKKNMPLKIKFLIWNKLIAYPKLIKFIMALRYWTERSQYLKKLCFLDYFTLYFIRLLFIPILEIIINKKKWKSLFIGEINKSPALTIEFSPLLRNTNRSNYKSHITETNNFADTLSNNSRQIYNCLKRESM